MRNLIRALWGTEPDLSLPEGGRHVLTAVCACVEDVTSATCTAEHPKSLETQGEAVAHPANVWPAFFLWPCKSFLRRTLPKLVLIPQLIIYASTENMRTGFASDRPAKTGLLRMQVLPGKWEVRGNDCYTCKSNIHAELSVSPNLSQIRTFHLASWFDRRFWRLRMQSMQTRLP